VRAHEEPDGWTSSIGLNRRRFVQRAAVLGGTFVWATPVVQSLAGPALAAGSRPHDISYLAVLLRNGPSWYRMKWDTTHTGSLLVQTGPRFAVPGSPTQLMPPGGEPVRPGSPPGTGAAYEADGSITLRLGDGTALADFTVKRGQCGAGPGVSGQPRTGQVGGTVRFPGPQSNRRNCV
jgi:hypothetical protein